MNDKEADKTDRLDLSRQNIYLPGDYQQFSVREAARITGYAIVTVNLICRQLDIGKKVGKTRILSADDVRKIAAWQKSSRIRRREGESNMTKRPARPVGFDPLAWRLYDGCMNRIEDVERKMYNKEDAFSYWNKFSDIQKTFASLDDRIEDLKQRLDQLVKLVQEKPKEGKEGRGGAKLGSTDTPSTLNHHEAKAA